MDSSSRRATFVAALGRKLSELARGERRLRRLRVRFRDAEIHAEREGELPELAFAAFKGLAFDASGACDAKEAATLAVVAALREALGTRGVPHRLPTRGEIGALGAIGAAPGLSKETLDEEALLGWLRGFCSGGA